MKKATTAAIYSATLAPGAGLFFLRHHLLGGLFLGPSLIALFVLMRHYFVKAQAIIDQVAIGRFPLDLKAIVTEVLSETDPALASWLWQIKGLFIAIWLLSIPVSAIVGHWHDKRALKLPPSI